MEPITLSIFDLFKVGPGPSSSHTMGPMWAGYDFRRELMNMGPGLPAGAEGVEAVLLGSLAATGAGHGTHRAVLAGLSGNRPDEISAAAFAAFNRDNPLPPLVIGGRTLALSWDSVRHGPLQHNYRHPNTLIFRLLGRGETLLERVYYSVGGGMVEGDSLEPPSRGVPAHPYSNMNGFLEALGKSGLSLPEMMYANEEALTGASREETGQGLNRIIEAMNDALERGLAAEGVLPGEIGLARKAGAFYARRLDPEKLPERLLLRLNAFALAVSEENADGGIVVTAPTMGSAGVIPALLRLLTRDYRLSRCHLRDGLLGAAAVGFVIKHNASISGAEVGCQGEIGAASAMGAALLCIALGFGPRVMANAAETALEHHLGMTCDPVGGHVQIPCIERNAMGAVKAYNSYILAATGDPALHKVDLDVTVRAMLETGRAMSSRFKETSLGGLALSMTAC